MKKKLLVVSILILYVSISFSQSSLDAYKYIIIQKKYDFLKEENQYRLNSLTKFLFEKNGFETILEDESYPADLLKNPCLGVLADVKSDSNMFTTKLTIALTDCYNKVIYTSIDGRSKEKEFDKTYTAALRNSFVSFEKMDYKFDPTLAINLNAIAVEENPEIQSTNNETQDTEKHVKEIPVTTSAKDETQKENMLVVAAVPALSETKNITPVENKKEPTIARSYKNDNISFFLIEQNNEFVAYVNESNNENYKKGEMIGTFVKTSLPNVFRVSWKNQQNNIDETTAYFDEAGNLKIDINRNGKIEVITFVEDI
jgi:hypothetical protein